MVGDQTSTKQLNWPRASSRLQRKDRHRQMAHFVRGATRPLDRPRLSRRACTICASATRSGCGYSRFCSFNGNDPHARPMLNAYLTKPH